MRMMKLSLVTNNLNGVPFNEYYQENINYKGLVFIQHGYQSNKSYGTDYLALTLARDGFFVVSIDSYKHGERIEEPYLSKNEKGMLIEAPIVIRHTAIDIIKLHKIRYKDRFPKFDLIGISMGAMIAYYVSTKTDKIRKLVPVIGTMDYMYQAKYNLTAAGLNVDDFLNQETRHYLEKMSPVNHVNKMKYDELLILTNTLDKVVPMQATAAFYNENRNDKMSLQTYEDGHEVNRKMQLDIFAFIDNNEQI